MTEVAEPSGLARVPPNATRRRAEALGNEMLQLTARISAAQARFIHLLAEFDRDELWRCFGSYSAAQWLSWKCGLGEVAAREHVRVAHAVERLPRIRAAFSRGEIGYSKVREITRVATPENEHDLLSAARRGTAADVERLVRRHRRIGRNDTTEHHRRRCVRYHYDDDGMLVIEARLPPEVGEVVQRALDAAVEEIYQRESALKRSQEDSTEAKDREVAAPEEIPDGTVPSGTMAPVPDGTVLNGTEAPRTTAHVLEDHTLASAGARRADALRLLAESFLASGTKRVDTSADRYQVVVHVDHSLLMGARNKAGSPPSPPKPTSSPSLCELENGTALAVETARKLMCNSALVGLIKDQRGEPLSVGRKTRAIPPAIDRALRARDRGCRFPGCGRTRFTEGHHVVHWINGGETKLSNLVLLCSFHHGLIHDKGFTVERTDDGSFLFFAPDGSLLSDAARESPFAAALAQLEAARSNLLTPLGQVWYRC